MWTVFYHCLKYDLARVYHTAPRRLLLYSFFFCSHYVLWQTQTFIRPRPHLMSNMERAHARTRTHTTRVALLSFHTVWTIQIRCLIRDVRHAHRCLLPPALLLPVNAMLVSLTFIKHVSGWHVSRFSDFHSRTTVCARAVWSCSPQCCLADRNALGSLNKRRCS